MPYKPVLTQPDVGCRFLQVPHRQYYYFTTSPCSTSSSRDERQCSKTATWLRSRASQGVAQCRVCQTQLHAT